MKRSLTWASVAALFLLFSVTSVTNADDRYGDMVGGNGADCHVSADYSSEVFVWLEPWTQVSVFPSESDTVWTLVGIHVPGESNEACYVQTDLLASESGNEVSEVPEDPGNQNDGGYQTVDDAPVPTEVPADDCLAENGEPCPGMGESETTDKGVYPVLGNAWVDSGEDGLWCRTAPPALEKDGGLEHGHMVDVLDDDQNGWQRVVPNGWSHDCFVSEAYLSYEPVEALAPEATQEPVESTEAFTEEVEAPASTASKVEPIEVGGVGITTLPRAGTGLGEDEAIGSAILLVLLCLGFAACCIAAGCSERRNELRRRLSDCIVCWMDFRYARQNRKSRI